MDSALILDCLLTKHFYYAYFSHNELILENFNKLELDSNTIRSIEEEYFSPLINPIEITTTLLKTYPLKKSTNYFYPTEQIKKLKRWIEYLQLRVKHTIFSQHKFHPYLQQLLTDTDPILNKIRSNPESKRSYLKFMQLFYDQLMERLVKEVQTKDFKKELSSFKLIAQKNYQSLCHYINQLLTYYPNLMVIHLDLHYDLYSDWNFFYKVNNKANLNNTTIPFTSIEVCNPKISTIAIPSDAYHPSEKDKRQQLSYDNVKAHREIFFKQLKRQPFGKYLVGHAWKMDHNDIKGYFHHFLLFFDMTIMPDKMIVELNKLIGSYWKNTITQKLGLGVFNSMDLTKMSCINDHRLLHEIISMMTLLDGYLRFIPVNSKDRIFDRGRIFTKKKAALKEQQAQQTDHWFEL